MNKTLIGYFHYTIEMFNVKDNVWETENRFYKIVKKLTDFDLHDIKNKRKNAIFIKQIK